MARDRKASALSRVARLQADHSRASVALERLTAQRRKAIIEAVAVGNSKAAVGRVADVSAARVSAIVKEG